MYDYLGPDHLNLRDSPQFDLVEERNFEIDRNRWLIGSQPTWNALPAVQVYRLNWHGGADRGTEGDGGGRKGVWNTKARRYAKARRHFVRYFRHFRHFGRGAEGKREENHGR
jgi:hypothetical protein